MNYGLYNYNNDRVRPSLRSHTSENLRSKMEKSGLPNYFSGSRKENTINEKEMRDMLIMLNKHATF